MSLHQFESAVRRVHDHLYANANIRLPEELQEEFAKILLAIAWGHTQGRYVAPSEKQALAIAAGDEVEVLAAAAAVRRLFGEYQTSHKNYRASDSVRLDGASIAYVAAELRGFTFEGTERDWLGDALEVFRSTAAKRIGGQFFTDQRVTELAMTLLEFDPAEHDLVDVCAGTGGFLIAAQRHANGSRTVNVKGIEVDAKLAQLANTTVGHFGAKDEVVFHGDSLKSPDQWPVALRKSIVPGTHRRLASNPPFGTKITIKDRATLGQYDLAHGWRETDDGWSKTRMLSPRPPDILFLERNLRLAEPGVGRVALVTPYQTLSGPKVAYVREWLLRHARIVAVVDLPDDTFQPWTGTKTSLLVFERREEPLVRWNGESYPVFMSVASQIGHDRRGKPVLDQTGEILTDLPTVGQAFKAWREGEDPSRIHEGSFVTDASAIRADSGLRVNAAFYVPTTSRYREHLVPGTQYAGYDVVRLGDVVERVFCPGRFKRAYVEPSEEAIPFLGGSNITQVVTTNRKYLSPRDPHLGEMQVKPGWILVTRSGSTGIVSSVPAAWDGVAMSEHVIRIIPNEDRLPGAYIESFLRSALGQDLLAAGVFGSVIDEITTEYVESLPIPVPRDQAVLLDVAETQRQANEARSLAMKLISHSLDLVDDFHSSSLRSLREGAVRSVA